MDKIKEPRLYCFSPAVMLATLTIEIILAIYTFWKYKLNAMTRIVIMLLICLALFQWAEYNVCEGAIFLDNLGWAKLGYIAITMLPPLGIHLIYEFLAIRGDGFLCLVTLLPQCLLAIFYWRLTELSLGLAWAIM